MKNIASHLNSPEINNVHLSLKLIHNNINQVNLTIMCVYINNHILISKGMINF
jgi:hypothetical protein